MTRSPVRMVWPVLLGAISLVAAAYWTFEAVVVPRRVETSLRRGLSPYFPGGMAFSGAVKTRAQTYRVLGLKAFAPERPMPWLEARITDITVNADGAIASVRLGGAMLWLDSGPAFLPPGAFHLPDISGPLPDVSARRATVVGPMSSVPGARIPLLQNLDLDFEPDKPKNLQGRCDSMLGNLNLIGHFDRDGRSALRAVLGGADDGAERRIGPVILSGACAGAFTFQFGGGKAPLLAGNLSVASASLAGVSVQFRGVRIVSKAGHEPGPWQLETDIIAATGRLGQLTVEQLRLQALDGGLDRLKGSARLWDGELRLNGRVAPRLDLKGEIADANLANMPPGLLGAATPAGGRLDASFVLRGDALHAEFDARNAQLWQVPFLKGIGRAVPAIGPSPDAFRRVAGGFVLQGGVARVTELSLEGAGLQLDLVEPGQAGPARRLHFLFSIRLAKGPRREGLPPLRSLVNALGKALVAPLEKHFLMRVHIGGTLDRPVHRLLPPGLK